MLAEAERTGLRPVAALTRLALAEARQDRGADAGETLAILDETVREAGEMHLRDVGLQAHNLAIGLLLSQAETKAAVEHVVAALKLLEEMRQGLHGDALDSFLARAATRSFAQPATLLLETSGSELQRTRLQSALTLEP